MENGSSIGTSCSGSSSKDGTISWPTGTSTEKQSSQAAVSESSSLSITSLADDMKDVCQRLTETHGKEYLGMPTKTLETLDKYTMGIRGFMLLAGAPGQGKTTLGLQIGMDIVANNDEAAFVFLSFEMTKAEMIHRLLSSLSGLSWNIIMLGSNNYQSTFANKSKLRFCDEDMVKFNKAKTKLEDIGRRIVILDQECLGTVTLETMKTAISEAKQRVKRSKAYVLIDSLQAMSVKPPTSMTLSNEVERDNYVLGEVLRLQRASRDAIMLITEQNKDGMGKDLLKSTRGTARAVYSADCVMMLCKNEGNSYMDSENEVPMKLNISKGRDGTRRGTIELIFQHECSKFVEPEEDTLGVAERVTS